MSFMQVHGEIKRKVLLQSSSREKGKQRKAPLFGMKNAALHAKVSPASEPGV